MSNDTTREGLLPELPEPMRVSNYTGNVPLSVYTTEQMRQYARAAIAALTPSPTQDAAHGGRDDG